MRSDDFDYPLPEELIAQFPPETRGDSRLLVFERKTCKISHHSFSEIPDFFTKDDLIIFNDTRVIPARLSGHKESGGRVELLLVRELEDGLWECMVKASKSPPPGTRLYLGEEIEATVEKKLQETSILRLKSDLPLREAIERHGTLPLPPYIRREVKGEDSERYQTIYAARDGAVAAPTAGLHFTPEILDDLKKKVAGMEMITLHVGPGTFMPVRSDNVAEHKMHKEYFEISEDVARRINSVKAGGGRVAAVGTTVVRALESSFEKGKVLPKKDFTDIFVRPGHSFNVVDMLVTNFHLPKSTLLMLVAAFAGQGEMKRVYEEALREKYRFFSYGDAMLII